MSAGVGTDLDLDTGLGVVELAERQRARAARTGFHGMVLLVGAEVVFFVGLIWVALAVRQQAPIWPPVDAPALDWPLLGLNTTVLLASAVAMLAAQRAASRQQRRAVPAWIALALLLGAGFVAGQWREFQHIGGWQADGHEGVTFRTLFNVLTGFHAAHVGAGALILLAALVRALRGQIGRGRNALLAGAALYWYLVAAVWLVLLAALLVA